MSHTFREARDILSGYFRDGWVAAGHSQDLIAWDGKDFNVPHTNEQDFWVRHNLAVLNSTQATLAGEVGTRRFERSALITLSSFTKRSIGLQIANDRVDELVNIYEGKQTQGIWFRNVRPNPVGPDGGWFMYNILIDVIFDEIK